MESTEEDFAYEKMLAHLRKELLDESRKLVGKNIVITGKLTSFTRDEARQVIESCGGHLSNTVTFETGFLVVAEKPGATKLNAARRRGIPLIQEKDFYEMIKASLL